MWRADELLYVRVELVLLLKVFDVVVVEVVAAAFVIVLRAGAAATGCADNDGLTTKAEQNT